MESSIITEATQQPASSSTVGGIKNRKLKGNLENFKTGSFNGRLSVCSQKSLTEAPLTAVVDAIEPTFHHPINKPSSSLPPHLTSDCPLEFDTKAYIPRGHPIPSGSPVGTPIKLTQAQKQSILRKKRREFSINIERPISDRLKQTRTGSLDIKEDSNSEELIDDFISQEMNFKQNSTRSPPIITVGTGVTLYPDNKDDISLYGTPKEETAPVLSEAKASFMRNQIESLFQASDNKLAMKLFGSKKALMNERLRQKESGHWIIHPCSNFR